MKPPGSAIQRTVARAWLAFVFAFLYVPLVGLVVFSFNASPLPSVWGGASLRWYRQLLGDRDLQAALWLSLEIAAYAASASVLLGTLAALALVRHRRFTGRALFSGMLTAPLIMPEVIIGLSLLLLLVSVQRWLGIPERGLLTIWIGHVLLGLAYATVVVQARLKSMDPALEEAAADLGAKPFQVFAFVTMRLIAESMASAWLLTFTLSLDDVVVSAFLSGPGSTTLPLIIFSRARLGQRPDVNAAATLIILVVALGTAVASAMMIRAEGRRATETARAQRGG